ncbi:MAG: GntR family transcriptional regulator [Oscillospiraceae bacterium]
MVFMISINYRDPRPIYEQVRDALRKLIVSGSLPSDQKLPSVRELASSLAINPNTIQRAYRELEQEGYICTVPGKGSFACARTDVDEERKSALLHQFDETVGELLYLGVSPAVLCARIRKGEEPHD